MYIYLMSTWIMIRVKGLRVHPGWNREIVDSVRLWDSCVWGAGKKNEMVFTPFLLFLFLSASPFCCVCVCAYFYLCSSTRKEKKTGQKKSSRGEPKSVGEKSGEKKKKRLGDENGTEQNALEAQCCCSLSTPVATLFSASLCPMRIHINKWWMLKDASISFASVSLKRVREEKAENDNFALDGLDGCCFGALSKMELTE